MAGHISFRESIRWLPDEPSEPTSTIVLTSPQRRFVDLRVLKGYKEGSAAATLEELDWGIAGTSSSSVLEDGTRHGRWEHWVDSRFADAEAATDEGDEFPAGENLTLEKWHMVNPATGKDTEYEELWRSIEPERGCVVMQVEGEEGVRGRVLLLGRYCQGILRVGERVGVQRWVRSDAGQWERTVWMGGMEMPCETVVKGEWKEGDTVEVEGRKWTVVEVA
ncbi:hypothetical protein B0I35DRAFT_61661 [Stachybotrys elegans]|uniref:Protein HRI1 n=1 Tax=Stachybotrys elegans TaxID=80388 RepID=A0A8K0SN41_9HYPO|nr:hypothetical protein B0I35DRAFT_61661 [Stachybotrys elegans]